MHALDNLVWHAITGPRSALGLLRGGAGRFDPEVGPFGALDGDAWDDLASLVGPGRATTLFRPGLDVPDMWGVIFRIQSVQMVATSALRAEDGDFVELAPADVPDMLALIERTRPGPFGRRTIEFGGYIGVRMDGRLVAMAGERMRGGGFTEISAVCTDEDHRGKGLGTALVRALVHRIRARGEEACLHAASDNAGAIRLYSALGFEVRCELDALGVRAPGRRTISEARAPGASRPASASGDATR